MVVPSGTVSATVSAIVSAIVVASLFLSYLVAGDHRGYHRLLRQNYFLILHPLFVWGVSSSVDDVLVSRVLLVVSVLE